MSKQEKSECHIVIHLRPTENLFGVLVIRKRYPNEDYKMVAFPEAKEPLPLSELPRFVSEMTEAGLEMFRTTTPSILIMSEWGEAKRLTALRFLDEWANDGKPREKRVL